jgi:hypothetical protein
MSGPDAPGPGEVPKFTVIAAPPPVAATQVHRELETLANSPEVACAGAWTEATSAWWHDDGDRRLRRRALTDLLVNDAELEDWVGAPLDADLLVAAHAHVSSSRAGVERDRLKRRLASDGLRVAPVMAQHRHGARTMFPEPAQLPALVAELGASFAALPAHPFVRAAWLVQALGAVHPFEDGNGGTSRFLASLALARAHLPPLMVSAAQRNGPYIDAIMRSNRTGELHGLVQVVHDVVQHGLAITLLDESGPRAGWDRAAHARADTFAAEVERRLAHAVGVPGERGLGRAPGDAGPGGDGDAGAIRARLLRRGYSLPLFAEAPLLTSFTWATPLPAVIDAAIVPARGGPVPWLLALVAASLGHGGELGPAPLIEPIEAFFVAPANEPQALVAARFTRWLDRRLDQCVRGLASWM